MTHDEQHKMIIALAGLARKMKRSDQEEYEMFAKRDKDDEDLDEISRKKLIRLYEQLIGPWEK
jgi:hypothetical protein